MGISDAILISLLSCVLYIFVAVADLGQELSE